MVDELKMTMANPSNGDDQYSLMERIFDHPDRVSEGEYTAIYEFLLSPDIRDDPDAIAGVLTEFVGWAQYMLEQMQQSGLIG